MAFSYNLTINQGETFSKDFTYTAGGNAVDLGSMQVRPSYAAATTLVSLTSGAGDIALTAAGVITVTISATATAALAAPNNGVYDLEIIGTDSTVTRLLQGNVSITPEVTK